MKKSILSLAVAGIILCAPMLAHADTDGLKRQIVMAVNAVQAGVNLRDLREMYTNIKTEEDLAGPKLDKGIKAAVDDALDMINKDIIFLSENSEEGNWVLGCISIRSGTGNCDKPVRDYFNWLGMPADSTEKIVAGVRDEDRAGGSRSDPAHDPLHGRQEAGCRQDLALEVGGTRGAS